jgi:hypothetical protein
MTGDTTTTPTGGQLPAGNGSGKPPAETGGENLSTPVRMAVEARNAAAQLVKFGHGVRSLGLASWSLGISFAAAAMALRFLNEADMEAPEFVSCFVFASLLVLFGIVVYILESRGHIKLVSEIAVKQFDQEQEGGEGASANGQS